MYSPKISEDLIPVIKRRSMEIKKPMTKVIDKILRTALITEKVEALTVNINSETL